MLARLDLEEVDYLIGGESDFSHTELVDSHFINSGNVSGVRGILYKKKDAQKNTWVAIDFTTWDASLDRLKFPDRSKMNNGLHQRPDTDEPQATIVTSRGCGCAPKWGASQCESEGLSVDAFKKDARFIIR